MTLERIELETAANPDICIIWLHGLGADGHDFEGIIPELGLPESLKIRFIFPHAPYRPITLNNGYVMRGWFDIASLEFGSQEDAMGINESADLLRALIEEEMARGIQPSRIILAGFSQGGAVALHTGLHHQETLGGIMILSSYLPLADHLDVEATKQNRQTPIFIGHGFDDEIVKYQFGAQTRQRLETAGYLVEWHDYNMGHSVCMDEITDIRAWLTKHISV